MAKMNSTLGVSRYLYVASETVGQMCAVVYYSARMRRNEHEQARGIYIAMRRYVTYFFSANKEIRRRGRVAGFGL